MKKTYYEPGELVVCLEKNNVFVVLENIKYTNTIDERYIENCRYRVYDIKQTGKLKDWFYHDQLLPLTGTEEYFDMIE